MAEPRFRNRDDMSDGSQIANTSTGTSRSGVASPRHEEKGTELVILVVVAGLTYR